MKNNVMVALIMSMGLLTACGGGGDSGSSDKQEGVADQDKKDNTGQDSTNQDNQNTDASGYITLAGNTNAFSKCQVSSLSQAPSYLACLSGTYVGKTPAGKECSVEFNGDTFLSKYKVATDNYTLFGSEKERTTYARINNDGKLALLTANVVYNHNGKDETGKVVTEQKGSTSLNFSFRPDEDGENKIDFSYTKVSSNENVDLSCQITKYKPS